MDVQRSHTLDSITDISNRELPDLPPEAYGSKISRIWSTFKKKLTLHRSTSAPGGMRRSHSVLVDLGWYFLFIIKWAYTICSPSIYEVMSCTVGWGYRVFKTHLTADRIPPPFLEMAFSGNVRAVRGPTLPSTKKC